MELTFREARNELRIAKTTLLDWLKEGKFPNAYKLSQRWRIPQEDIEALKQKSREAS